MTKEQKEDEICFEKLKNLSNFGIIKNIIHHVGRFFFSFFKYFLILHRTIFCSSFTSTWFLYLFFKT
jgi:hypothetical protein